VANSKEIIFSIWHMDQMSEDDQELLLSFINETDEGRVLIFATALNVPSRLEGLMHEIFIPGYNNSQKREILLRNLPTTINIGNIIDLMIANDRATPGMDELWSQVSQLQRRAVLNKALGIKFEVNKAFFEENVEEIEQPKLSLAGEY
jgi:hypothetical protein